MLVVPVCSTQVQVLSSQSLEMAALRIFRNVLQRVMVVC